MKREKERIGFMKEPTKILGDERRAYILKRLQESRDPITGSELASITNVSRQVIVGDVTLDRKSVV